MIQSVGYLFLSMYTIHINRTMIHVVINKYEDQEQQKLRKYRGRFKRKELFHIVKVSIVSIGTLKMRI